MRFTTAREMCCAKPITGLVWNRLVAGVRAESCFVSMSYSSMIGDTEFLSEGVTIYFMWLNVTRWNFDIDMYSVFINK